MIKISANSRIRSESDRKAGLKAMVKSLKRRSVESLKGRSGDHSVSAGSIVA